MADRAERVAEVINTPSLKDRTQEVMGKTIDSELDLKREQERRKTQVEQSKENF